MQSLHYYPLEDKYYSTKMRVKALYLSVLEVDVKNWQLDRAVYVLRKMKVGVNVVSLASMIYLLYKYDLGIHHLDFVLMMKETRERWRSRFKKLKKKFIEFKYLSEGGTI